jgi:hypothetical protein
MNLTEPLIGPYTRHVTSQLNQPTSLRMHVQVHTAATQWQAGKVRAYFRTTSRGEAARELAWTDVTPPVTALTGLEIEYTFLRDSQISLNPAAQTGTASAVNVSWQFQTRGRGMPQKLAGQVWE